MYAARYVPRSILVQKISYRAFSNVAPKILKNEEIRFPFMRVVFKDPITEQNKWEMMERSKALSFAKAQNLDLILGKQNI